MKKISLSFIARSPGDEFAWQLPEWNPTSFPELSIASESYSEAVRVNFLGVKNSKQIEQKSRVLAVERKLFYSPPEPWPGRCPSGA